MKAMKALRINRLIAVLVGVIAISIFATDVSAMYHPGMGRFMQRDPGAVNQHRIGATGVAAPTNNFIPRDPTGSNQYADGMNLYQYVRSNPENLVDWNGHQASQPAAPKAVFPKFRGEWTATALHIPPAYMADGLVSYWAGLTTSLNVTEIGPGNFSFAQVVTRWQVGLTKKGDWLGPKITYIGDRDPRSIKKGENRAYDKHIVRGVVHKGTPSWCFYCEGTKGQVGVVPQNAFPAKLNQAITASLTPGEASKLIGHMFSKAPVYSTLYCYLNCKNCPTQWIKDLALSGEFWCLGGDCYGDDKAYKAWWKKNPDRRWGRPRLNEE